MKLQMDFSLVSKLVIMSDCDWCNAEMEPGRPGNERVTRSPGQHFGPGRVTENGFNKHYVTSQIWCLLVAKHDAKKQKLQSKCWDSFRDIVDDCGNKLYGIACCSICGAKLL